MKEVALLFPGQGSQYVGMGKELCNEYKLAEETFKEASEVLGFDLKDLCLTGDKEELKQTENTQPAVLTQSVAVYRVLNEKYNLKPVYCAGHSLGEITALTCTGAIDFTDAVRIVRKRGLFMKEAAGEEAGTMAAVMGMKVEEVEQACLKVSEAKKEVIISNYNAPNELVISGFKEGIEQVKEDLSAKGAAVIPLQVSAPFHSSYMEQAADKLEEELKNYTFHQFKWPVISNIDAKPYSDPEEIRERLKEQMVNPVLWSKTINFLEMEEVEAVIELGGKDVLKNLTTKITESITAYSFSDQQQDLNNFNQLLADNEQEVKKKELINKCLATAVCTKNNNWNNEEYRKGVIEPYNEVSDLASQLEKKDQEPTLEEVKQALKMLRSVFKTKQVPKEKQQERLTEILAATQTRELFSDFEV